MSNYLRYYSSKVCVVCGNGDFDRYDHEKREIVMNHRLKEIELRGSGLLMAVCNTHYSEITEAITNRS